MRQQLGRRSFKANSMLKSTKIFSQSAPRITTTLMLTSTIERETVMNDKHQSSKANEQENDSLLRHPQQPKQDHKADNLGVPTPGRGTESGQKKDEDAADSGGQDSYEPAEGEKHKPIK